MKSWPLRPWRWLQSRSASPGTGRARRRRNRETLFPIATEVELLEARTLLNGTPGTWTALTHTAPPASNGIGTMVLLTNGVVMAQGGGVSKTWYALIPDATGDYINGTWSTLAQMSLQRLYTATNVLPSGKVFELGGEYSGPSGAQNLVNSGQIYDPAANTWTNIPNFPEGNFGDDPSILLPNGKILAGSVFTSNTYLFNPASNTWSATGAKLRGDRSDEESWVLMPNGKVLSYDVFASPSSGPGSAQMYDPSTGTWSDAGVVPVALSGSAFGFELGAAHMLPDGRVFLVGTNANTVFYTPSTNTWAQGPSTPGGFLADDAPGAMLPNGHVIFASDSPPGIFTPPTKIFDFDPAANTITDITPSGNLGATLNTSPSFVDRMLVLPSGNLLLTTGGSQLYEYTPIGTFNAAWQPTVSNVTLASAFTPASQFTLTGTQLTGLSAGAAYGDDAEMDSNYPIVRLTSPTGIVKYGTSSNWTPGVSTGAASVTAQFQMPAAFGPGVYTLNVIANGIPSADYTLRILAPPQNVNAVATSTTTANVTWSAVAGADLGYQIYANGILKGTAAAGATSGSATGLTSGANSSIVVRALSTTYLPGFADSAAFIVAIPAPLQAPTGVTALALSPTTAKVTWNPVIGADLGYTIWQSLPTLVQIGTAPAGATSVITTGMTPGGTDKIFVRALSSYVTPFSKDSALVSVVMPAAVGTPVVSVSNKTQTTAVLSWPAVGGVDGYRIYQVVGGTRILLGYVGNVATPSVKLVGLKPGTSVTFIVEAYKGFVFTDTSITFTTLP
jgi:hypothetical protein